MRRRTCVWLIAALVSLLGSVAAGQVVFAPGPENTLSVTVTGSAESPADWAEVTFAAQGQGATAQEALALCDESWQKLIGELAALQIPEDSIRSDPPEIGPGVSAQMMVAMPGPDEGEAAKQTIRRNVTVRLGQTDAQTLYEAICQLMDAAADAGAALRTPGPMEQVYSSGTVITFGVKDPKPLRAQATTNGLAAAREVGEAVAMAMGRKLGAIAGVQASEVGGEGYLGMLTSMGFPPKPGVTVYRMSLTLTFQLE